MLPSPFPPRFLARVLAALFFAAPFALSGSTAARALDRPDAERPALRPPLDLPSGGGGSRVDASSEDESALESIVAFGATIEGDTFIACFELSAATAEHGIFEVVRRELSDAIASLGDESAFTLVSFDATATVWSERPRAATPSRRDEAIEWLDGRRPGGEACLAPGFLRALEIAQRADARDPRIIVVAVDAVTCAGIEDPAAMVEQVTAANWGRIPVDVIDLGIIDGADRPAARTLQRLAERNGGRFIQPRW